MSETELTLDELKDFHGEMQKNLQMIPLMEKLFKFVEQAANGEGPVMTSLMIDFGNGDQKTLLKLWATASLNSPMDRIAELIKTQDSLEEQLAAAVAVIEHYADEGRWTSQSGNRGAACVHDKYWGKNGSDNGYDIAKAFLSRPDQVEKI